jgi:hypothetical protein
MSGIYIHSAATFIGEANEGLDSLKEELRRYTRENFRRVNRFILITLLGACKCIHQHSLEPDSAVYLTTEHGNLGETAAVLDEIYAARSLPKPYGFINTMSSTAAFYLAQNLGIRGRNITISSQDFSFERGLDLLTVDFSGGIEESALIGGVDGRTRLLFWNRCRGEIIIATGDWLRGAAGFMSSHHGKGPAGRLQKTGHSTTAHHV